MYIWLLRVNHEEQKFQIFQKLFMVEVLSMVHKVVKYYVNFSTLALVGARITTMLEKLVIQHCQHFLGARSQV